MKISLLFKAIAITLFFGISTAQAQTTQVIRVNKASTCTSGCDGSTWAKAYPDLGTAILDHPYFQGCAHYQYWVAGGVYRPTTGGDRTKSFVVGDYMDIYGGFIGTENALADRTSGPITVLSGDINVPQASSAFNPPGIAPAVDSLFTDIGLQDNSYNVIYTYHIPDRGDSSIIDGLYITGGCAYRDAPAYYNDPLFISEIEVPTPLPSFPRVYGGGGMYIDSSSNILITNCTIAGNYTPGLGGGVAVYAAKPIFQVCVFDANYSKVGGGALFELNGKSVVSFSQFLRNAAKTGGAMKSVTFPTGENGGTTDVADPKEMTQKLLQSLYMAALKKSESVSAPMYENVLLAAGIVANGLNIIASQTNNAQFQSVMKKWVDIQDQWIGPTQLATQLAIQIAAALDPDPARTNRLARLRTLATIYNAGRYSYLYKNYFYQNYAEAGGAIFTSHSNVRVTACEFSNNSAHFTGGAMYNEQFNTPIIESSIFHHNTAFGAYPCIVNSLSSAAQILNCTFSNNSSPGSNGESVAAFGGAHIKVANSIFWNNTAQNYPNGGADLYAASTQNLPPSTLVQVGQGTSEYVGVIDLYSSIVQQLPTLVPGVRDVVPGCAPWVDPRCVEQEFGAINLGSGVMIGAGVLAVNPHLDGQYTPPLNSVAIDKGNDYYTSYSNLPIKVTEDFALQPRKAGSHVDIGAMEAQTSGVAYVPSTIIYVDQNAAAGGDGTSWTSAYQDLQLAIRDIRAADANRYKQVWVAKGTYKPTNNTDRSISFRIPLANIKYFGGFAGGELDTNDRISGLNPTYLSGDIGTANNNSDNSYHILVPDVYTQSLAKSDFNGFIITSGNANGSGYNAYGGGIYAPYTQNTLSLKNCTVTNNSAVLNGGAIYNANIIGIDSCTFTNNYAQNKGGAIFNQDDSTSNSIITNSRFINNSASVGGAFYQNNFKLNQFFHCRFSGNHSTANGGAVWMTGKSNTAIAPYATFNHCLFDSNYVSGGATGYGGAIYVDGHGFVGIEQSTLSKNFINASAASGAAVYNNIDGNPNSLLGSIIWENRINGKLDSLPYMKSQITGLQNTQIDNSCIQNYEVDPIWVNPAYKLTVSSDNPSFVNPAIGDYHLQICSRSINKGYTYNTDQYDLDGNDRVYAGGIDQGVYESQAPQIITTTLTANTASAGVCSGGLVKINITRNGTLSADSTRWQINRNDGKGFVNIYNDAFYAGTNTDSLTINGIPVSFDRNRYRVITYGSCSITSTEQQIYVYGAVIYVDSSAAANGTGQSWATAYRTVRQAIDSAFTRPCAQIWVAKGTYYPTANGDRDARFTMKSNVSVYGGFGGNETLLSQRDWNVNVTTISGDIGTAGLSTDNSRNIFFTANVPYQADTTAVVDGFTLSNTYSESGAFGAVSISGGATPQIRNCNFVNNYTYKTGAALNIDSAFINLENCRFTGNHADGSGGAVWANGATLSFNNCYFENNSATIDGGAILGLDNHVRITNSQFLNNAARLGGAISYGHYSTARHLGGFYLANSLVKGNTATGDGGGLYLSQGTLSQNADSMSIRNVDFISNTGAGGGGAALISSVTTSNIVQINGCNFKGNIASNAGGGLVDTKGTHIASSVFSGNKATLGGGIYYSNPQTSALVNSDVVGNYATTARGGGMETFNNSVVLVYNSILYNNFAGPSPYVTGLSAQSYGNIINSTEISTADHYIIQGGYQTPDPQFVQMPEPFIDPTGGDLHLKVCSPLVNAGSNSNLTYLTTLNPSNNASKDLDGNARIYNNGVTDIGAFEVQQDKDTTPTVITAHPLATTYCSKNTVNQISVTATGNTLQYQWYTVPSTGAAVKIGDNDNYVGTGTNVLGFNNLNESFSSLYQVEITSYYGCVIKDTARLTVGPSRLYVNVANTSGVEDGRTWATAYKKLTSALAVSTDCVAEIWVAKGTYYPYMNSPNQSFQLRNGLAIYGGFIGTEDTLIARNIALNKTTLSGDLSSITGSGNAACVVAAETAMDRSAILDGFTVTLGVGGHGATSQAFGRGAGLFIGLQAQPTIRNCNFISNTTNASAGAVYDQGGAAFQYCRFEGNGSTNTNSNGGAVLSEQNSLFISCSFKGNKAYSGSAIFASAPFVTITNCEVSGNTATISGAVTINGGALVINTTITGNKARNCAGLEIYGDSAKTIANSIIWGNLSTDFGAFENANFVTTNPTTVEANDIQYLSHWPNSGNVDLNPLFVSGVKLDSIPTTSSDLHLSACSPVINMGGNSWVSINGFDRDSLPRIQESSVDMGPFEHAPVTGPSVAIPTSADTITTCDNQTIKLPSRVKAKTGVTYQWQASNGGTYTNLTNAGKYTGVTTDTLQIATADASINNYSYRCVVTAPGCDSVFYPLATTVKVNSAPTIQLGNLQTTYCISNTDIAINYLVNGVSKPAYQAPGSFTGDGVTYSTYFNPTIAGVGVHNLTYTYTYGNGCSTQLITPVEIFALPATHVVQGPTVEFCTGSSIVVSVDPVGSYLWSTGAVTKSITINTQGQYSVTVTDANGCKATDQTFAIERPAQATIDVSAPNGYRTCDTNGVVLEASYATHVTWAYVDRNNSNFINLPDTTQSIVARQTGYYFATYNNIAGGCGASSKKSDLVEIFTAPDKPGITVNGSTELCGGSVQLTATVPTGVDYTWSTGQSNTPTITANAAGIITLTANKNGCTVDSSATIFSHTFNPDLYSGGSLTVCSNSHDTIVLEPYSLRNGDTLSYKWYDQYGLVDSSLVLRIKKTGQYYLVSTNSYGCTGTSQTLTATIDTIQNVVVGPAKDTLCKGAENITVTSPYVYNTWYHNNGVVYTNTPFYTPADTGWYYIDVTNSSTGCMKRFSKHVDFHEVNITQAGNICTGPVLLTAHFEEPNANFEWSTGETTPSISVTQNGIYKISATYSSGCVVVDSVVIQGSATPTVSITASNTTMCAGTPVTFTAQTTFAGTNPTYKWTVNGIQVTANTATYTDTFQNANVIACIVTNNQTCAAINKDTSNSITLTVRRADVPVVSLTASNTSACPGAFLDFTANYSGMVNTPLIQFLVNGNNLSSGYGVNTLHYNNLQDGDVVVAKFYVIDYCTNTSYNVSTNPVTVHIGNLQPTITIAALQTSVCPGTNVHFTATTANGGTGNVIWRVNNGTRPNNVGLTFDISTLNDGDVITATLSGNLSCAIPGDVTSGGITISVTQPATPIVTITSSAMTVCEGEPVTFIAVATGAGNNPTYDWIVDGNYQGVNSDTFITTALTNRQEVTALVTTSASCGNLTGYSSDIRVTVNPKPNYQISIPNSGLLCPGTLPSYTASAQYGFDAPHFQWYQNGLPVGTDNRNFTPTSVQAGDIIYCNLSTTQGQFSFAPCLGNFATSNKDTIKYATGGAATISITTTTPAITAGQSVTFTASYTNGGTNPIFSWLVNNQSVSASGSTYTSNTLVPGDVVSCSITSNASCAGNTPVLSNSITLTNANATVTPTITISTPNSHSCVDRREYFTAVATNGGSTPHYQWLYNGNAVGTDADTFSIVLADPQDYIRCQLTSSAPNASPTTVFSNYIIMGLYPQPALDLGADTTICGHFTLNLDASYYSVLQYQWSTNATTPNITVTQPGFYSVTTTDVYGCSAKDTIQVICNSSVTVFLGNDTTICSGTPLILDAENPGATYLWSDGSTNQTLTVTQAGTYSVTVTNGISVTSSINVGVKQSPVVNLGADGDRCLYSNLDAGNQGQGATFLWSMYNWTHQTLGITQAGPYSVTVTKDGCSTADTVSVTIITGPAIDLGNDTTVCGSYVLDAGPANRYYWSDNSSTRTITVTQTDDYDVSTEALNGCYSESNTVHITVLPALVIALGNDTTICGNFSRVLDAGNVGATYLWSDGSTNQTFTVTQQGNYAVTATNSSCSATDAINIMCNTSSLTVSLGNDTTICSGSIVTLDAGNVGATYLWSDGSTNQTLLVTQSGNYSVIVTNGVGTTATASIRINVNQLPAVTLGGPYTQCGGTVTLNAGNAGASYLWSDGSTSQTLAIATTGRYSVTVTANGCSATASDTVTINSTLSVSLGGPYTQCGGTITLDAGNAGASYLWSDGSTSQTLAIATTGRYSVTVTANGCSATASDTVTINATLSVSLGGPYTQCGGTVTLNAGNAGASYLWSDGSTNQTLTIATTGRYAVTVTANGCSATASDTVTINPTLSVNLGGPYTQCGGTVTLNAGNAGASYLWSDGSTNQSLTVATTGRYSVTVTSNGCSATASDTVTVNSTLSVSLGGPYTQCGGTVTLDAGNAGASYLWSDGSTNQSLTVAATGRYAVTVTASGCSATASDTVTINSTLSVSLGGPYTQCGGTVTLNAGNAGASYLWSDGSTNQTLTIATTGRYSVTVTANGCSATASDTVTINSTLSVSLGGPYTQCGGTVTLNAGNAGASYLWSDGSTNQTLTIATTGRYSVTVTANSCSATASDTVTINSTLSVSLGGPYTQCGGTVTLNAGNAGASFLWSDGSTNQSLTVAATGRYGVTVTSNGCSATASDTVTINPVLVPSAIVFANQTAVCAGTAVTFTATVTNEGTAPVYQWVKNGANVGTGTSTYTDASLINTDSVWVILISNALCTSPASVTSNKVKVTLSPVVTPSVSITSNHTGSICVGTAVTFTASTTNGGLAPVYVWHKNGVVVGGNTAIYTDNTLNNNDTVSVQLTSNAICATSNIVNSNSIVTALTPAVAPTVSISANQSAACFGTAVTFTANVVNNGLSGFTYRWTKNGNIISNNNTASYTDNNVTVNDTVSLQLSGTDACSNTPYVVASNSVIIPVTTTVLPTAMITASDSVVCTGSSVSFTATVTNGGTTPAYIWKKGSVVVGTNSSYTDNNASASYSVQLLLVSNAQCAIFDTVASNMVHVRVNPMVNPLVNIVANQTTLCAGSPVKFTATVTNGGSTPSFVWTKNGIAQPATGSVYVDSALTNNDTVWVIMTSNATCATVGTVSSNRLHVPVTQPVLSSATITALYDSICSGQTDYFTATPVNGGANPLYVWTINGIPVLSGISNSYSANGLVDHDTISVQMTSSLACVSPAVTANSTKVITVLEAPGNVITLSGSASFCPGDSVVLTAPAGLSYLWNNGTMAATNVAYTAGAYTVMVSNGMCTTPSLPVNISVFPGIPKPVIVISGNTLFSNSAGPVYQWYRDSIAVSGTGYSELVISQNGIYSVVVTDNNGCEATSNPLDVQTVGIETLADISSIVLFPNPTSGQFVVSIKGNITAETVSFQLYDALGRLIVVKNELPKAGGMDVPFDISNLAKGFYQLSVKAGTQLLKVMKIVKE